MKSLLPSLRERSHQLRALVGKVEEQQAYVLIFGPLKSGKSTLMNAIAGNYVSEVTTLPAYPCMVFVKHAKTRVYQLTRYDGRVETLHDAASLRMTMNRAHAELVEKIREVEETGADFDPASHFPAAIRRIDVCVPADSLRESGTVIVDTPGLYSRMRFGYDRMTREFRDTATCAIFVVKTDNLFLEQVFDEFHELLELFSKVFLVVNLDTTKRDLRPDGSLVPSLESEDPVRLVEAFENLSMSASLKQARDDGRLKIYPVDLMNAASRRLSASFGEQHDDVDTGDSRQSAFETFLSDLTSYLDSDEYLVSFLGDSLRQAETIVADLNRIMSDDAVQALQERITVLEQNRDQAQASHEALSKLRAVDWGRELLGVQTDLLAATADERSGLYNKTKEEVEGTIEQWFQETSSLRSLVNDDLPTVLRNLQAELISTQMATLRRRVHQTTCGFELDPALLQSASAANMDLASIAKNAIDSIDAGTAIEHAELPLHRAAIPVRKGFWDWILFRNVDKVRTAVLGAKAEHRLTRSQKQKRLGTLAQVYMKAEAADALDSYLRPCEDRLGQWISQSFAHFASTEIIGKLDQAAERAQSELSEAQSELQRVADLRAGLAALETAVGTANTGLGKLADRYAATDPSLLETQALEVEAPTPEPELELEVEPTLENE